jgi:hypothetical protein
VDEGESGEREREERRRGYWLWSSLILAVGLM